MYEAYFHLQKRPFSATPDASCLYAPEPIQKLLDDLLMAARSGQGIGVLTAAAGTGKTLVCRRMLLELEPQFTPIFLANANFPTRRELLQAIHFELGRRYSGIEEQELRIDVISSLESLAASGRPAVLIVDEAHLLNERLLEELRTMATLSKDAQPLLRMVLVGHLGLEMRLTEPSLEALNQRIVYHGYLDPLTRAQSRDYVAYRIGWAGGEAAQLFDADALDRIAEACNGLPRCLNQLCDHSLLLTFVQEAPRVTRAVVDDALTDLRQLPLHWNESLGLADEYVEASPEEVELSDGDPWESQSTTPLTIDQRPTSEAGATFEIGVDADAEAAETFEFAPPLATSESPIGPWTTVKPTQPMQPPATSTDNVSVFFEEPATGVRVFREEFVDDRYAALDQRMPGRTRTFEESAIPEGWRPARHLPAPTPPEPPAHSASLRAHEQAAIPQSSDMDRRTVDETLREPIAPPAAGTTDSRSKGETIDRDALLIEQTVSIDPDLEEEISNSVLDVFADVQSSLGQWWDAPTPESVAGASVEFGGLEPRPASPYDVVEPDQPQGLSREMVEELMADMRGQPAAGRYVPKPSYRHMFSKLRRKAGHSTR